MSKNRHSPFPAQAAPPVEIAAADALPVSPALAHGSGQALRDYLELTKPEISFLVTVSAFAGFLLGSPGALEGWLLFYTLLGTGLTSAGVGALNHCLEWEIDARMRRTADRPIPAGRIPLGHARIFGALLVIAGVGILCPLTNPLTGILAALTVVLYLYVYTPLKRRTTYNTLIGTIPGALPALGGWTAATGSLGLGGWAIFLILALWQMPHFLALAWMYRKDYARGNFAMLTVADPEGRLTARQTLLFTLGLVGVSVLPAVLGVSGWLYLIGVLLLGIDFLIPSWSFFRTRSPQDARHVLMASIRYIPLLVALILADRFV